MCGEDIIKGEEIFRDSQRRLREIEREIQRLREIFRDFQRFSEIFRDFQRNSEKFRDFQKLKSIHACRQPE